ncbi:membrane protein [Microbacterium phage Nicole72]|uniref:Membrane protein n=1 Tax=Microbacterium phage Nicole72 TaxID=3062838 RepID=A0ACD4UHI7_9CAUD|nr:membrane protein [Microbacterium phage Nicole72]
MRKSVAALSVAALAGGLALVAPLAASATQYGEPKCYGTETHTTYAVEAYVETAPAQPDTLAPRFDYSETRATGHFEATEDGLHIWTEGSTSTDKVALYRSVSVPLSGVTSASVSYTATTGITPGSQVVVDINGDGVGDGILVNEPVYGDVAWLSNSASAAFKAGAPHVGGGYGSENYGTLSEWGTAFPDATVVAVGFSLGSGVLGDGVVHAVNVGGVAYTFTQTVPGAPATYGWVATGETGHALTLPADTETTRYVATGTKVVKVEVECVYPPVVTPTIIGQITDPTCDKDGAFVLPEGIENAENHNPEDGLYGFEGDGFHLYVRTDAETFGGPGTYTWEAYGIGAKGNEAYPIGTSVGGKVDKYGNPKAGGKVSGEFVVEPATGDCPVPTPTPTDTATPAPIVPASTTTTGALAQTGLDSGQTLWALIAAAGAVAVGGLLTMLGLRRRQVRAQR